MGKFSANGTEGYLTDPSATWSAIRALFSTTKTRTQQPALSQHGKWKEDVVSETDFKKILAMLISVSEKRCSWDVPSVTNGSVDCGNLMGQNVDAPAGHVCQVTCIQGYRMNENATNKIICDPNNSTGVQWIRENLYCGKQTFKIMQWQKILSSICIPFRHRSPASLPFS